MPPKPRPHTPKKRVPLPAGSGGGRSPLVPLAVGAGGLVVLAVVLGFVFLRGGSGSGSTDAQAALKTAGCSSKTVKALPRGHTVTSASGTAKWNTFPPTNGPHFDQPALWGSYTEPLQQAQVVHNLEHGGVFIQYGSKVSAATVAQLQGFYQQHLDGTLLAPLPALGDKIALGAWVSKSASQPEDSVGHLALCTSFDEKAFSAFFTAYQFKGPERFPPSAMTPGS